MSPRLRVRRDAPARAGARAGACAAHHHERAHHLAELLWELLVHHRLPHEPAHAVGHAPHKLAVRAPRPAPHAVSAEGAVGEVSEAGQQLEGRVLVRHVRALVIVDHALVARRGRVHVEAGRLPVLEPQRPVEFELDELERGGGDGLREDAAPGRLVLVLARERVLRPPDRHRAERAAHPHGRDLEVVERQLGAAAHVEHHACAEDGRTGARADGG